MRQRLRKEEEEEEGDFGQQIAGNGPEERKDDQECRLTLFLARSLFRRKLLCSELHMETDWTESGKR